MTVNRGGNFVSALAIGFRVIIAAGFECPVAKDPVSFIGDNTHSAIFMWDCSLLPNESVRGVTWFKESTVVATFDGIEFKANGSYAGRVERNGTFGISLHNISKNDSGHYNISVFLRDSLEENNPPHTACQSVYLPALPTEVWKYNDWQHQLPPKDGASSLCGQEGASKLAIGLLCGLVPVTIIGLVSVSCFFYRKRRNNLQREDTVVSSEEMQTF